MKAIKGHPSMRKLLSDFYLPIFSYCMLILTLFTVGELKLDVMNMQAMLGIAFAIAGASFCYFASLVKKQFCSNHQDIMPQSFWIMAAFLFTLLFFDSAYDFPKLFGKQKITEIICFLTEGCFLAVIILLNWRLLNRTSFVLLAIFGVMATTAILIDYFLGEGVVHYQKVPYSYEQMLETLSLLLLATCFVQQGLSDLSKHLPHHSPAE